MNLLIPPIKPDQQGEVISNLQEILQSFVERGFIKLSIDEWNNILPDFSAEQRRQYYGERTADLVLQFRMQNNLGDGRDVDEATAKTINSLLEISDKKRKVTGTVLSADGKPAACYRVFTVPVPGANSGDNSDRCALRRCGCV